MKKELITQGGVATLPQLSVQTILLDFDGELTRYDGEILTVDRVEVEDSGLTQERIGTVISRLNEEFAALNVSFTADPAEAEAAGEYIYKAFYANGISIPFPQMDVHVDNIKPLK